MASNWLARVTSQEARIAGLRAVGGKKGRPDPKLSRVLRRQLNSALDADKTATDRVYRFHGALMRTGPVALGATRDHAVATHAAKEIWQEVLSQSLEFEETERQVIRSANQQPNPKFEGDWSYRGVGWKSYGEVLSDAAASERAKEGTAQHISAVYAACVG